MRSEIKHVLLDADGVLQRIPGGWAEALRPYLGERADDFFAVYDFDDAASMRGEADFLPVLAGQLARFGVAEDPDRVYTEVWLRIEPDHDSLALVQRLRRQGLGVHLATNQEARRAAHMMERFGYAALFDECFVSCWLGTAKPDRRFFEAALDRLGCAAAEVLFVDDHAPNVAAAEALGIHAVCWRLADGHAALATRLSAYGLDAGESST